MTLQDALAIAAGGYHNLAIRANGKVVAWGANDYGQTNVPEGLSEVIGIAAGTWHSVALRANGTVAVWGDNTFGQTNLPGRIDQCHRGRRGRQSHAGVEGRRHGGGLGRKHGRRRTAWRANPLCRGA